MTAKGAALQTLSRREREIVNVIFAAGNRATSEEIRTRLADPPSSSAVRAMLTRLEAKGAIRHEEEGLRYVYSATTSPVSARRAALQEYVKVFFAGSREELVTTLLTQESWSAEELDAIEARINLVRKGKNR